MKYNNLYDINTDDWYDSAVDLKAKGMSNRGIARTLLKQYMLREINFG